MSSFTNFAYEKMMDLYLNHADEVGIDLKKKFPAKYKDYKATDCITYSLNVISYAFEKAGNRSAGKHVWKLGAHGTDLAKYLVNTHKWKGVYINPDHKHQGMGKMSTTIQVF